MATCGGGITVVGGDCDGIMEVCIDVTCVVGKIEETNVLPDCETGTAEYKLDVDSDGTTLYTELEFRLDAELAGETVTVWQDVLIICEDPIMDIENPFGKDEEGNKYPVPMDVGKILVDMPLGTLGNRELSVNKLDELYGNIIIEVTKVHDTDKLTLTEDKADDTIGIVLV